MSIPIKSLSGEVLHEVAANTLKGADLRGVNLRAALLSYHDLTCADLSCADLSGACLKDSLFCLTSLKGAYLEEIRSINAVFYYANLEGASFKNAYLRNTDFSQANLQRVEFEGARISSTDFTGADLRAANFRDCEAELHLGPNKFRTSDLRGCIAHASFFKRTNMVGVKLDDDLAKRLTIIPEGEFVAWKKTREGVMKIRIPASARRSNATTRKCRAEYVVPIEMPEGYTECHSSYDYGFTYRLNEIARCNAWNHDRWMECSGGIHFFLTREEAENYVF